jgi:hypothetical protein
MIGNLTKDQVNKLLDTIVEDVKNIKAAVHDWEATNTK